MIRRVYKQMTGAQIVSAVTVTVCLLIDSIVIGRMLGVDAVGAYGLANPVIILFSALGIMESCGVQVVTGDAVGKGDVKACNTIYTTSIMLSLCLAAAWILVVFGATDPLCTMLGAGSPSPDNRLFVMTGDYLKGYMIGAPFFFLSQIMTPYLQLMGKRKLTVTAVTVMTVTDIVFDLLSVYVFHAGMFGIGLASSLSYLAALLVGLTYLLRRDCLFQFDRNGISVNTAIDIVREGSPIMVNQACFMLRVYVINRLLLAVSGTVAVAVFTIVSTIGNIVFSIGLGAGSVTLMLASILHSEEDRSSLYELMHVSIRYSAALISGATLVVEVTAPWLIRLFLGHDPYVTEMAVPALRLYMISLIAVVISTNLKNYYQGTGRMKFTNVISICDNAVLLLPITWLFASLMGLTGLWIGIIAGQFATILMICIVVWIRCGRISFSAEAFCMLDDDFGAAPEDVFEEKVTDIETAISASEAIDGFCSSKGMGRRLSGLVSLCVEEIVANIIEHGFTKDDHEHQADVRLVVDESKCIIRIRDNCIGFDPTRYLELHRSDDPADHIGIRIVTGMVSEINYINSLGLNNLYMSLNREGH